jgi:non-ribosomal peptide synthetase component F
VAVLGDPALAGRIGAAMLDLSHRTDEEPAGATGPDADPGSVCCLQYTDGAKGPCGVRLRHESVANLCASLVDELGLGSADTVLVLPSILFSVSATELWLPLIAGAKLVMAPADAATDGARLSRVLTAERISFLHASPSTWQTLIDSGLKATRGLAALSGGGELTQELADQLLGRVRVLWNAYGAPETTFYSTLARVDRAGPVTIGRPLANTRAYVLDAHDEPVPVGFTGRLVIAGVGVASGLGQRPGDVEGALVSEPGGSASAYDTGDRAHWRTDGELTLASRATSP